MFNFCLCQYFSPLFSFFYFYKFKQLDPDFSSFQMFVQRWDIVTSGNMAFKLLAFTDLLSKLFLNNFKEKWEVINTDSLNTSFCKKLEKVFINTHYCCPLNFLWRMHCWKNCKICPICDLASRIMDKIIYISQIKWSETREHAEHICFIADSAILPIKYAYRIKISSATSLDHMTSQNGKKACSGTVMVTEVTSAIWFTSKDSTCIKQTSKDTFLPTEAVSNPRRTCPQSNFLIQSRLMFKSHWDCMCW